MMDTLRRFTGFYSVPVPVHNAFNQAFNRLTPRSMTPLSPQRSRMILKTKLRIDTTVVENDIHWPTEATLLWDTVRVLTHLIGQSRVLAQGRFRRGMLKLQRMPLNGNSCPVRKRAIRSSIHTEWQENR
jgi:hypothetical protein